MDKQRLATYLQLIQALLEYPSGEEDILNANRELVDANFVQVVSLFAGSENLATGDA